MEVYGMRPVVSLNRCRHGRGRDSIRQVLRDRDNGMCLQCVKLHLFFSLFVDFHTAGAVREMSEQTMGMRLCRSWWNSLLVVYAGEDIMLHQTGN